MFVVSSTISKIFALKCVNLTLTFRKWAKVKYKYVNRTIIHNLLVDGRCNVFTIFLHFLYSHIRSHHDPDLDLQNELGSKCISDLDVEAHSKLKFDGRNKSHTISVVWCWNTISNHPLKKILFLKLAKSFITSVCSILDYCSWVWFPAISKNNEVLQKLFTRRIPICRSLPSRRSCYSRSQTWIIRTCRNPRRPTICGVPLS